MAEKTWKDYPRLQDKVAIVGFSETTRGFAPYHDDSYEIWALNEEYTFPWCKRYDRWFQMHPRWDFERNNNLNHPNHILWLKNKKGECRFCKGKALVSKDKEAMECPYCKDGVYTPKRKKIPIYMQRHWKDIPDSVALPLKEMHEFVKGGIPEHSFKPRNKYFASSPAYMLVLAMLMGYKTIELYGFEMGTSTEYHYQRANFEYLIGVAHGKGIGVYLHPRSQILKAQLYGYVNNQIGLRQNFEIRRVELAKQVTVAQRNIDRGHGFFKGLERVKEKYPDLDLTDIYEYLENKRAEYAAQLNVVTGAQHECNVLTDLVDGYMLDGNAEGDVDDEKEQS